MRHGLRWGPAASPTRRSRGRLPTAPAAAVLAAAVRCAWRPLGLPARGGEGFATVTSLHRYPVKSCLGEELRRAIVLEAGFEGDRTYAVCLLGSKALTQRECPRLAAITAKLSDTGCLQLSAVGVPSLELAAEEGGREATTTASVLGGTARGIDQGDQAAAWVSEAAGLDGCRLLRRAEDCQRRAVGYHWADLAPLLVASEESLAELGRRAGRPVPMGRFRPNIVIGGAAEAHAEDRWRRIRVGTVVFEAVGPCARCSIVEVDPARAARDGAFSVYGALAGYREQVTFGQYFRPVLPAAIEVGAEVTVLQ